MRAALLGLVTLGLAAALASALPGCWVSGRAGEYACDEDTDCADLGEPRRCDTAIGYCVPVQCPAVCDSCDLAAMTCAIRCGQGGSACGAVTCPAGFACDVTCTGTGACGSVTCGEATSCTVACSGGNPNNAACAAVTCGAGPCAVTCGDNACGATTCGASCACDISCATPQACDTLMGCAPACIAGGQSCDAALPGCSTCP